MIATWNPAAASAYYTRQTEYYAGSGEPAGIWYAPAGDFGIVDGALVEDKRPNGCTMPSINGRSLLEKLRRHKERTPAFDITLSAPRSVGLILGPCPVRYKVVREQRLSG